MKPLDLYQNLVVVFLAVALIAVGVWAVIGLPETDAYTLTQLCVKGVLYFERTLTPVYDANSLNPITCEESK